jgi:hypothetical protein
MAPVQPIHYSLIFNVLVLLIAAAITFVSGNVVVFVLALATLQHMVGRFGNDDDEDPPGSPIGFHVERD